MEANFFLVTLQMLALQRFPLTTMSVAERKYALSQRIQIILGGLGECGNMIAIMTF